MKLKSKLLTILSSIVVLVVPFDKVNTVSADVSSDAQVYSTGGIWSQLTDESELSSEKIQKRPYFSPSYYDITTDSSVSVYFPEIGDQGSVPSCSGWASTYYQFTFEINKLNNIPSTPENVYSPAWTYNYLNGGGTAPVSLGDAYEVLQNQGAVKMIDYPHISDINYYSFDWCNDPKQLIDALEYRGKSYTTIDVNEAKHLISKGKVAVIWTNNEEWSTVQNDDGEYVIVRGGKSNNSGHYMTVVGYDDNFEVTVNGVTLVGAFKLANSWGKEWANDGYVWVSYDALKPYSFYGEQWQECYGYIERGRIFGGENFNQFSFLDIHHCDVYYAGIARLNSNDMWGFNVNTAYNDDYSASKWDKSEFVTPKCEEKSYILAFDYFSTEGIEVPGLYNKFRTIFSGNGSQSTYGIKIDVFDNLYNRVSIESASSGKISMGGNYTYNTVVYLNKGRVSAYDDSEITYEDVNIVRRYLLGDIKLSNLQMYLADYNSDGVVNLIDLVYMQEKVYFSGAGKC